MDIGVPELVIVLAVIMVVFGPKQLPELARSIGQAVHELRSSSREHQTTDSPPTNDPHEPL